MEGKNIALIFIVILIIAGLFIGGYYLIPTGEQVVLGECTGGTTILSIDNALITTSQDLGGKEAIRVTAVANQGGECARIEFRDYELEAKLQENGFDYDVENSVYGDLITNSQTQIFTINPKESQFLYNLKIDLKQEGILCSIENCEKTYTDVIRAFNDVGIAPCYCVYKLLK